MIESGVRIVFEIGETEHVLALASEHFPEPFTASGRQDMFEADGILAEDAFFRPLGGASWRVGFVVDQSPEDRAAMQTAMIATIPFRGTGELRIELPSGDHLTFAKAALVRPKIGLPAAGEARTHKRWEFIATAPTLTTPA